MDFSLICPTDGRVEVSLEDIASVVFRDPESVDVLFTCPRCGRQLKVSVHVTNMLMAVLEIARGAEEGERQTDSEEAPAARACMVESPQARVARERLEDSYCEYFRRQLSRVQCVEDLLAEIDSR